MQAEALLAAGYALLLLAIAFGVERLARRTNGRSEHFETRGFAYQPNVDAWECPAGAHLPPVGVEYERRLARYRAPATTCNRCPLKPGCTDSDQGRELTRALDPWLESEIGRFHRACRWCSWLLLDSSLRSHSSGTTPTLTCWCSRPRWWSSSW